MQFKIKRTKAHWSITVSDEEDIFVYTINANLSLDEACEAAKRLFEEDMHEIFLEEEMKALSLL